MSIFYVIIDKYKGHCNKKKSFLTKTIMIYELSAKRKFIST